MRLWVNGAEKGRNRKLNQSKTEIQFSEDDRLRFQSVDRSSATNFEKIKSELYLKTLSKKNVFKL